MKKRLISLLTIATLLASVVSAQWTAILSSNTPAAATGMTTPVFICSGSPSSINPNATEFIPFTTNVSTWLANTSAETPMSIAGTAANLYVIIETAPGAGASWTFTLYKNGSATALTTTISDAGLSNSDTTHTVSFNAGDTLTWGLIPSATDPTTPTNIVMSCTVLSTNAQETFFTGGSNNVNMHQTNTEYRPMWTNTSSETEAIASSLMPMGGTIDQLRIALNSTPGAGNDYTFTFYKNGSPTAVTCVIADSATTGSDLTHSFTFAAGDTISLQNVPNSTPSARSPVFCVRVVPTINGESVMTSSFAAPAANATVYTRAFGPAITSNGTATASTGTEYNSPIAFTLKNLYTACSTVPGALQTRTSKSYVNAGIGTLTAQITAAATTANDITHSDSIVATDKVWFQEVASLTAAAVTWYKIAAVQYIAP